MEFLSGSYLPKQTSVKISAGTLEAIKWFALLAMSFDHVNKYLFNGTKPLFFAFGRLALPLFIFVLAFNLARPQAFERGVYIRTFRRLTIFGVLSSIPYIALGAVLHGWWPLNILFTLALITAITFFLNANTKLSYVFAFILFAVGGSVVEFVWPAVGLGVALWAFFRWPGALPAIVSLSMIFALSLVNGSHWALLALPILLSAPKVNVDMPRLRWFFYGFYPAHLCLLWVIRIPMRNAGYLFF